MTDYNQFYWGRVLNGLSQLGNAISGGNPDISVSARVGQKNRKTFYWKIVNSVIDFAFYPIDGNGHCIQAYQKDLDEDYSGDNHIGKGNIYGFMILTILVSAACLLITPITWLYFLIKTILK